MSVARSSLKHRQIHEAASAKSNSSKPLQIICLDAKDGDLTIDLNRDNLDLIFSKVPPDMKVAVVSVVGAFRTGKSFLLTFLLRYLRYGSDIDESEDWMSAAGDVKEGNLNEKVEGSSSSEGTSFAWRAGKERTTTGIWLWSEPYIRKVANGEEVAILLMDTQGMFDNETSMNLTACIFGLSTLLSSYQIYNVQNRIQEDHLQHLALFSEYGRLALLGGEKATDASGTQEEILVPDQDEIPFQRIEFLVRDWMNFDDDQPMHKLKKEMDDYLQDVISKGHVKDLKETRDQILSCFQKVRCFILPHPGMEVPKKSYSGNIHQIEPFFRKLLNYYSREVFGPELEPKRIHKRDLTGPELRQYVLSYVDLFKAGKRFPEARTMLEATALANNQNAKESAVSKYRNEMDRYCGPKVYEYRRIEELVRHHNATKEAALRIFDTAANIGRKAQIKEFRHQLEASILDLYERYEQANSSRNPFRWIETYGIPLSIALMAWLLRWVADADATCSRESRHLCDSFSRAMANVYVFIITFIVILSFQKIKLIVRYAKSLLPVLLGTDRLTIPSTGDWK